MGNLCQGKAAKSAGNFITKGAGEAGQSLLKRVETKFGDKMDEVINERLAEKCDATFSKAVDILVDKTFAATFDKAFKIMDNALESENSEDNKIEEEIKEEEKSKKEITIEKLKQWGIPQTLINEMDSHGWLDERNWDVLTKHQCEKMGFGEGHIVLFMNGMNKIKQKKSIAISTLKNWGISSNLIEKMDEEGYLNEDRWNDLRKDRQVLKKRLGFDYKYIGLFLRGMEMRDDEKTSDILIKWGISETAIEELAKQQKLEEKYWDDMTKSDLKNKMNFSETEINLFMEKKKDRIKSKRNKLRNVTIRKDYSEEMDPSEILREWGIPSDLITKLKEEGWVHPEYWNDLLTQEFELEDLGFKKGHISTFKRKFQAWKEQQDSKRKERKIQLLRKLENHTKEESSVLKRNVDVENDTKELVKVRIIGERKYD
eukprot:249613_1